MSAIKCDLIPHSNARTSWELQLDTIQVIDEEPARFNWRDWGMEADDADCYWGAPSMQPACNTLACISGWIGLLATEKTQFTLKVTLSSVEDKLFPDSEELQDALNCLFYGEADYGGIVRGSDESQRQYANRGIQAIKAFMTTHEHALKAHKIVIPERPGAQLVRDWTVAPALQQ